MRQDLMHVLRCTAVIAIALVPSLASGHEADPAASADPERSVDSHHGTTESLGCIIGAAGMGLATIAAAGISGAAAGPMEAAAMATGAAASAGPLLPLITAGVAAGCAVGSAAAPGAMWMLTRGARAVDRLAMTVPGFGRRARLPDNSPTAPNLRLVPIAGWPN